MISRDHAFSPLLPPAAENQPLHPTVADTAGSCPSPITRYGLVHAVPVIVCGCKTPQPRHLNFGTTCTAKSLPDEIHVALIRHEHSNSDRKTHHRIFIHLTDTSTPSVCTHTHTHTMPSLPLERRQYYSDGCYGWGCGGNSGWNNWGRWILLALIIGVFLISFLLVCTTNKRRLNRGQQPITGTSWIVPPTYHQSEQQYQSQAAPPYNPNANSDPTAAGYYDQSGNFVNTSHHGAGYSNHQGGYTSNDAYGPPPGDAYGPPPGPPPGHSNIEMDQYQPPSHPPPAFVKN